MRAHIPRSTTATGSTAELERKVYDLERRLTAATTLKKYDIERDFGFVNSWDNHSSQTRARLFVYGNRMVTVYGILKSGTASIYAYLPDDLTPEETVFTPGMTYDSSGTAKSAGYAEVIGKGYSNAGALTYVFGLGDTGDYNIFQLSYFLGV